MTTQERIRGIHAEKHEFYTDGCWMCKLSTVTSAPSATPSRNGGAEAADINRREAALHEDRAAYKRLRNDGVQPAQVDGSAQVERVASDQVEIDYGHVIPPKDLARVKEIQAEVAVNNFATGTR